MLYHLLQALRDHWSWLNVFRYITFRSAVAFFLTLLLVLLFQPMFIRWFRVHHLGQPIRDDGPQSHLAKKGTPTMGGLVMVAAVIIATLLLADLTNFYVWVTLLLTASYGALGFLDDYRKVKDKSSKGVSARTKLLWQFGTAFAAILVLKLFFHDFPTYLSVPFTKGVHLNLGFWYVPFAALVIVGASNAVNLTDGLDGLVTGPLITAATAYGLFAYVAGNSRIAEYLQVPYVAGAGDLAIFASAIVAAGLGFLWYNSFPATVFMGDVGALAMGGALGILAIIAKQEIVLIIAGGIFVVEALSVILQVASFKIRGKRIFRMAPIHHHFELGGMAEPKIIVRAWILSIVLAIISLSTLKLR